MKMKTWLGLLMAVGFGMAPLHAQEEQVAANMEELGDSYKALKRAEGAEGVELAREAQGQTLKAIALTPAIIEKMPEGKERDLADADRRRLLGLVFLKFVEIEKAFLDGNEEAVEGLIDELKDLRKEGHKKYIEDEE